MTIQELIKGVDDETIVVDYGKAYLDISKRKEYFLEKLNEYQENLDRMIAKEDYMDRDYVKKLLEEFSPYELIYGSKEDTEGLIRSAILFEPFKLYSWIIAEDLYVHMNDENVITFRTYAPNPDHAFGLGGTYVLPDIPEDIDKALRLSISCPSKQMVLVNSLPEELNPEPSNRYGREYNICGHTGRRNVTKFYAEKNNVAYGQMGNMSLVAYSKGNEVLLVESYLDDHVGDYEHCLKEGYDVDDEMKENYDKAKAFLEYLDTNNFKQVGESLSLGVWRWEATDYEAVKDSLDPNRDKIVIDLTGDQVEFEHYYRTLAESPISDYVYSHFWIK